MENTANMSVDHGAMLLQTLQAVTKSALLRACLDCVKMAAGLLCAVLTTLIVGL
jgi:hypothetical protein